MCLNITAVRSSLSVPSGLSNLLHETLFLPLGGGGVVHVPEEEVASNVVVVIRSREDQFGRVDLVRVRYHAVSQLSHQIPRSDRRYHVEVRARTFMSISSKEKPASVGQSSSFWMFCSCTLSVLLHLHCIPLYIKSSLSLSYKEGLHTAQVLEVDLAVLVVGLDRDSTVNRVARVEDDLAAVVDTQVIQEQPARPALRSFVSNPLQQRPQRLTVAEDATVTVIVIAIGIVIVIVVIVVTLIATVK
jgi:hypothetical protein